MLEMPAFTSLLIRDKNSLYHVFAKKTSKKGGIQQKTPLIQNAGSIQSITKINYQLSLESQVQEKTLRKRNHSVIPRPVSCNAPLLSIPWREMVKEDTVHPSHSFEFSNSDKDDNSSIHIHFNILENYIRQLKMAGFIKITVAEVFDHEMVIHPPSHQTLQASATPSFSIKLKDYR